MTARGVIRAWKPGAGMGGACCWIRDLTPSTFGFLLVVMEGGS